MYVNVAGWKDQVCSGYIGGQGGWRRGPPKGDCLHGRDIERSMQDRKESELIPHVKGLENLAVLFEQALYMAGQKNTF